MGDQFDPFSVASYGLAPVGSAYPTSSGIGMVGRPGRPGLPSFHPENPMTAFAVVLGLTVLGFFAASYTGSVRVGPFKASGALGAGKK